MFWKDKICPVCKQEFKEDEDIVFCPDCGTAHHRACWQQNNSCFFHEEHKEGNYETTNEVVERREALLYSNEHPNDNHIHPHGEQPEVTICPVCGTYNKKEMRLCMNCGFEFSRVSFGATNPEQGTPNGGMDFSNEVEEGVTYQDLARYCGFMAEDYLRKFEILKKGGRVFSTSGFLLSFIWLFYRKMYGLGAIIGAICALPILIYSSIVTYATAGQLLEIMTPALDYAVYQQKSNEILLAYVSGHPELMLFVLAALVLLLASMIFVGLKGHDFYYKKAVADISKIKAMHFDPERTQMLISMKGGANMLMPFLLTAVGYSTFVLVTQIVFNIATM